MLACITNIYGQAPVITSFSPASGPAGTNITISGKNFNTIAANNRVWFGAVSAIPASATSGSLVVKVPAGASFQSLSVLNSVTRLSGYSTNAFATTTAGRHGIGNTQFAPSFTLPQGIVAAAVSIADMDGDGKPDMVVSCTNNDEISVYRNIGAQSGLNAQSFAPRVSTVINFMAPSAMRVADMDGDGKPDVISSYNEYGFAIFHNSSTPGNIVLDAPVLYAAGNGALSLDIADIDADGRPDVVATAGIDQQTVLSVFKNTATGGVLTGTSFSTRIDIDSNTPASNIAVCDIDADGKPDLVLANYELNTISLMHNKSTSGSIAFDNKIDFNTGLSPWSVAAADLDGDNKPDLVVSNSEENTVSVYFNKAVKGKFSAATLADKIDLRTAYHTRLVNIADIDADGKPEILATANISNASNVAIFRNITVTGKIDTTSFDIHTDFSFRYGHYLRALAVADLDGDGRPDLATIDDSLKVSYNSPRFAPVISTLTPVKAEVGKTITIQGSNFNTDASKNIVYFGPVRANVNVASASKLTVVVPPGASYGPLSVFNADTKLQASSNQAFIPIFESKHALNSLDFESKVALSNLQSVSGLSFQDIDGDGKLDMILGNTGSGQAVVSVYRNVSTSGSISAGSFPVKMDFKVNETPLPVIFKDMNGDGKPDMVVYGKMISAAQCYLNRSIPGVIDASSFAAGVSLPQRSNSVGFTFTDLDNDGRPEVIEASESSAFNHYLIISRNLSEDEKLVIDNPLVFTKDGPFKKLLTGDIDNDGFADIILAKPDSTIVIYKNLSENGNIKLSDKTVITISGAVIVDVKLADMNADNKIDLVVSYYKNGGCLVAVFKNISEGNTITATSFAAPVSFLLANNSRDLSISDVDGDGKPDIIVNDGNVSVLLNNSSTNVISFNAKADLTNDASLFSADEHPSGLAAYDLDLDGKQDIVYSDYVLHTIWFLHSKPQPAQVLPAPPVVASFSPVTAYNDDNITINGSEFGGSIDLNTVYFGATPARILSAGGTQLKVKAPAGSTYAPLVVLNKTTGLQAATSSPFVNKFKGGGLIDSESFKFDTQLGSRVNANIAAVGDLDGDGKPDVVFANGWDYERKLLVRRNITSIKDSIAFAPIDEIDVPGHIAKLILSDVDGDGKPDVVVTYMDAYAGFSVFRNTSSTGKISFAPKVDNNLVLISDIISGDVNGDGKPDIVILGVTAAHDEHKSAKAFIFPNSSKPGTISFGPPSTFITNGARTVALADIDGDQKPELIVSAFSGGDGSSNPGGQMAVLRNVSANGGIAFSEPAWFTINKQLMLDAPVVIRTGDMDGDGKPDIVVLASFVGPQSFTVFKNNSSVGKINLSSQIYPTTDASFFALGDINGDAKPDVLTLSIADQSIAVYQNNSTPGKMAFGSKIKTASQNYGASLVACIADLNADGQADLVLSYAYNLSDGAREGINILKNVIQPIPTPTITASGPLTFNTGKNVILTAHPDAGFTYQWLLNGDNIKDATNPTLTVSKTGSYSVAISLDTISRSSDAVVVNVVFTLPADNFQLKIIGASCKGSNNGAIGIIAKTSMAYTATITGNGLNKAYPFTTSVNIPDLAAGTYSVCMTVAGQPDYQQCFTAIVTEPKDLSVYSTVNDADQTITVTMDGGAQYNIKLNGSSYSTTQSSITLPLSQGDNKLEVSTDRLCQGLIQKLISYSNKIIPYPVPFENSLSLNLGAAKIGNVNVAIHDVADGKLVFSKQFTNQSGILQLNVSQLKSGVYGLHLTMGTTEKIFKILKK